ncbi:hypothetical protein LINGRAHAP2_LOCUS14263, partial [Linum grandiflorum]
RRRQRRQPAVADRFLPPLLSISFLSRSLAQQRPEATTSLFSSMATAVVHPPRRHSSGDGGDGVTRTAALFLRPEQRATECSINVEQPRVASTDDECSSLRSFLDRGCRSPSRHSFGFGCPSRSTSDPAASLAFLVLRRCSLLHLGLFSYLASSSADYDDVCDDLRYPVPAKVTSKDDSS